MACLPSSVPPPFSSLFRPTFAVDGGVPLAAAMLRFNASCLRTAATSDLSTFGVTLVADFSFVVFAPSTYFTAFCSAALGVSPFIS